MATAKRTRKTGKARGRIWPWLFVAVLVAVGAAWLTYEDTAKGYAIVGTSYGARVACSCRYVGGRSLGDCEKDFEPGMELISLSEDAEAKSVTASFPLLESQTATYREGYGCVLESWDG